MNEFVALGFLQELEKLGRVALERGAHVALRLQERAGLGGNAVAGFEHALKRTLEDAGGPRLHLGHDDFVIPLKGSGKHLGNLVLSKTPEGYHRVSSLLSPEMKANGRPLSASALSKPDREALESKLKKMVDGLPTSQPRAAAPQTGMRVTRVRT